MFIGCVDGIDCMHVSSGVLITMWYDFRVQVFLSTVDSRSCMCWGVLHTDSLASSFSSPSLIIFDNVCS